MHHLRANELNTKPCNCSLFTIRHSVHLSPIHLTKLMTQLPFNGPQFLKMHWVLGLQLPWLCMLLPLCQSVRSAVENVQSYLSATWKSSLTRSASKSVVCDVVAHIPSLRKILTSHTHLTWKLREPNTSQFQSAFKVKAITVAAAVVATAGTSIDSVNRVESA